MRRGRHHRISLKGDETEIASDGKGNSFTGRITFTNYLSSAAVATPQDSRRFSGVEAWTPTTGFLLDGRNLATTAGAPLQTVGRQMFIYNSRRAIFRSMSLLPFPTIGELLEHDGNSLVTRRLITNKFDSAGIVYVDQAHTLDDDAVYILDDQETTAAEAIAANRTIRVLAAQPLMLSTFTPDALLDATTDAAKAQKLRHPDGFITNDRKNFQETGSVATEVYRCKQVNLKIYWSTPNTVFPPSGLGAVTKLPYITSKPKKAALLNGLSAAAAAGIHDGMITEVSGDSITVTIDTTGTAETFAIADVAKFFVNGREQTGATTSPLVCRSPSSCATTH